MKHLLVALFMLSSLLASSQTYFTITAGPQFLSPKRNITLDANAPVHPTKGVAFNFEPEWRKGNHFIFGLMFSHAQFGWESHQNTSVSQAMLNFKFPFTIKRIQPYFGIGAGYLNQMVNSSYEREGRDFPTTTRVSSHYVGVSPYVGLTVFVTQKFRLTANYRCNVGIYSPQGFASTPVSSGFNIGINVLISPKYAKAG